MFTNVLGLDALATHYLLEHLQHNLPHLLIRRLELPHEGWHNGLYVLADVPTFHQWKDEAYSLEEGSKRLVSDLVNAFPQGLENRVKGLDTVGR